MRGYVFFWFLSVLWKLCVIVWLMGLGMVCGFVWLICLRVKVLREWVCSVSFMFIVWMGLLSLFLVVRLMMWFFVRRKSFWLFLVWICFMEGVSCLMVLSKWKWVMLILWLVWFVLVSIVLFGSDVNCLFEMMWLCLVVVMMSWVEVRLLVLMMWKLFIVVLSVFSLFGLMIVMIVFWCVV